jgi:PIN domain nuclease of toxin-antitoxin system
MRLLLDTQVALWWLIGAKRLGTASRKRIAASECVLSVASIWEVAIKHRLGRLPISPTTFRDELAKGGAAILAIEDEHAIGSADLPTSHGDPFDRLLLATAMAEGLRLITADRALLELASATARCRSSGSEPCARDGSTTVRRVIRIRPAADTGRTL